jgi:hypothetical protein
MQRRYRTAALRPTSTDKVCRPCRVDRLGRFYARRRDAPVVALLPAS